MIRSGMLLLKIIYSLISVCGHTHTHTHTSTSTLAYITVPQVRFYHFIQSDLGEFLL